MSSILRLMLACGAAAILIRPEAALAQNATMLVAWQMQQGRAAQDRGQWKAALASYREAVAMDSHDVSAHLALGVALVHCGDRAGAGEQFRAALRLRPFLTAAKDGLDSTFASAADRDAYFHEVQQSVQRDPSDAIGLVTLAELLVDRGDPASGAAIAREALRLLPRLGHAHCVLGLAEEAMGRDDIAKSELTTAVHMDRHDDCAWAGLGGLATKSGNAQDAVACYRRAVAAGPDHAEWHARLADAYATAGDATDAAKEKAAGARLASIAAALAPDSATMPGVEPATGTAGADGMSERSGW